VQVGESTNINCRLFSVLLNNNVSYFRVFRGKDRHITAFVSHSPQVISEGCTKLEEKGCAEQRVHMTPDDNGNPAAAK